MPLGVSFVWSVGGVGENRVPGGGVGIGVAVDVVIGAGVGVTGDAMLETLFDVLPVFGVRRDDVIVVIVVVGLVIVVL